MFVIAAGALIFLPPVSGLWWAVLAIELSFLFDCRDGILASHRKLASVQGHLFDFFTDEVKAVMLS